MWWCAAMAVLAASAHAEDNVTVIRLTLALEEEHTLAVDSSVEYILRFLPTAEQSRFPERVWVRSGGGDAARPLLVTARQRAGARTWQLPYYSGETLLYELERTLCPDDSIDHQPSEGCADEGAADARGAFTLHLGSSCSAPFSVTLRAAVVRDWRVARGASAAVTVSQAAPRAHYYQFEEGEESVRLVVASEDDVCCAVAVQEYTCPISETIPEMEMSTLRMTVQRSGGAQLSRERYPRGFYIIAAVGDTDAACTDADEAAADPDWLWEAAVWPGSAAPAPPAPPPRVKRLTLTMKASLSRAQYLVGTLATLAAFLALYAALGVLALAERWPRWRRLVAPRAVLARKWETGGTGGLNDVENASDGDVADAAAPAPAALRRRRDSDATFDSSDASDDSESDDGATTATATTTAALSTPPLASPPGDVAPPTHADAVTRADILERDEVLPAQGMGNGDRAVGNGGAVGGESSQINEQAGAATAAARPFGLPARLHVAALARRRVAVLRARSDRYLYALCTVGVFYALPVVQFVAAFQVTLNVSGSLDLCYYNFLCAHPLGALSDFNHVFSNLGYLLLGALFMVQVRRRRVRRKRQPRDEEYGIPQHYGLLSSLGAGMMMVALLSASYHVCPNRLNFQFDTAFMYVLGVLLMVKIYQSRHPDINARAHSTFGVLAALIALVVWGVLGGGALFWSVFTVLHVFTFLLLSLRIYYVGQFRLGKHSLAETARSLRTGSARPLYTARLVALLIANAVNWAFALYGLVAQGADIASHLLFVVLGNALLYVVFYLSMKLLHGERVRWYAWLLLGGAAVTWAPALYFFLSGSTDWSSTPARSRHRNHECRVLQFYDSHDLWHMLSALALYLTCNAVLTWDDGLSAVKRTDIAVF